VLLLEAQLALLAGERAHLDVLGAPLVLMVERERSAAAIGRCKEVKRRVRGAVFDGLGAVHGLRYLFLERWGLDPWTVLIMMQVSYLVMGMFLDDTAMLVIVAPLYVPLVKLLGFDLIWYGVLYTITCQIAYMTPPFGYNLFLMRAMAPPEVSLRDIYRSIVPFVGVMVLALIIVMAFPQIALWLPQHIYLRQ
jgi:TRAP-type mannitol/chloroaromatic compound transport system permease large subunit